MTDKLEGVGAAIADLVVPYQAEIDRLREEVERLAKALADALNADAAYAAAALAGRPRPAGRGNYATAYAAEAEVVAVPAAIPGVRFMDPPDGGDPKPHEQVQRMADALKAAETEVERLRGLVDEGRRGRRPTGEARMTNINADLVAALELAANRFDRLTLEFDYGTQSYFDCIAWAREARSADLALRDASVLRTKEEG